MRLDDYLLATSQGKTYLGRVAGEATYTLSSIGDPTCGARSSGGTPPGPCHSRTFPQPLPAKLHSQADVVELTN